MDAIASILSNFAAGNIQTDYKTSIYKGKGVDGK